MVQSYVSSPDYVLRLGLLAEIGRAFVIKDNRVVLWSLASPAECVVHEEEQVIRSIALVVPKAHVFAPSVRYLLVVATPILIRLLTVQFDTSSGTAQDSCPMELSPVMSVSTDGNRVESLVGTTIGRIFVGGDSGVLQELLYSSERAHSASIGAAVGFHKRARTVAHPTGSMDGLMYTVVGDLWGAPATLTHLCMDHHRQLLWTADAQGGLAVWSLGQSGGDMRLIQKVVSLDKLVRQGGSVRMAGAGGAGEIAGLSNPVVNISAVSPLESARVHAVLTTASGGRVFLTTCSASTYPTLSRRQDSRGAQKRLAIGTHVGVTQYLPPPPAVSNDSSVSTAFYRDGITLMSVKSEGSSATGPLLAVASDVSSVVPLHTPGEHTSAAKSRSEWMETTEGPLTGMHGSVHCVQEIPQSHPWGEHLAPSGAVLIQGGVTAPLPPPSGGEHISAAGSAAAGAVGSAIAPLDMLYSLVGSVFGGVKRPRAESTPASALKGGVSARLGGGTVASGPALPAAVRAEFGFACRRTANLPVLESDAVVRQLRPLSELAAQLLPGSVRQFYAITETHVHILSKVRPVDRLAQVLRSCASERSLASNDDLSAFVGKYGPVETCAMAASIACTGAQALLRLPPLHDQSHAPGRSWDTDSVQELALACLQVFADFTRLRRTGQHVERQYPAKTWGMLLYARRLLAVFWQQPVLLVENMRLLGTALGMSAGRAQLTNAQRKSIIAHGMWSPAQLQACVASLRTLQAALRRIYGDDVTVSNPRVLVEAATESTMDSAYDAMVAARLYVFLERVAQTFALGGILGDPATRVAVAFDALEQSDKKRSAGLTFEDLATGTGSVELISKLLTSVTSDVRTPLAGSGAAGAHILAERLGQQCPDFFAQEDSLLWGALRNLDKALSGVAGTSDAADQLVAAAIQNTEEALRLGRVMICLPNLLAVLDRLCALGHFPRAIELVVLFAQSADAVRWSTATARDAEAQTLLSALDKSAAGVNANGTRVLPALDVFQEYKRDERRCGTSWGHMLAASVLVHALSATVAVSEDSARSTPLVRAIRADLQRQHSGSAAPVPPGAFSSTDVLRYVVRTAHSVVSATCEPLLFGIMWWLSTPSDAIEGGSRTDLDGEGLTPSLRTLLLLASQNVPDFLRYTQQLPRLHMHYKLQGKPVKAARIRHALAEQATSTEAGVGELQLAVQELQQVLDKELATGDDVGIVLSSWRRELDVARLQQRVVGRLQQALQSGSGDAGGLKQVIDYLRREQLNIDGLFELCKEHRFIEEQLHLLHIVNSPRHLQMVHSLWEQLMHEVENTKMALTPSAAGVVAPGHRVDSSRQRLLANRESLTAELKLRAGRLAHELYTPLEQSEAQHHFTAFPVARVVFMLEEYGVRCGWVEAGQNRSEWVSVEFLNKAGVPWHERFTVYKSLLARNVNPDWTTLALVRAACSMINQWVALAEGPHAQHSRAPQDRAAVSAHELHALVGSMKDSLGDWSQLVREACAAHGIPTGPENGVLEHSKGQLQEFSSFMGDANGDAGGALM